MPSCEFLTTVLVVSVSTMLFFLITKKYISIRVGRVAISLHVGRLTISMGVGRMTISMGVGRMTIGISICLKRPSIAISVGRVTISISICLKRPSFSSSSTIIGGNDDLLSEILVRLPAKTVVRFKSVSKQWSSLISSEYFIRLHVQNQGRHGRLRSQHSFIMGDVHGRGELFICHHTIKKLLRISLPSTIKEQPPFKYFEILQSLNGLLLISMKFLGEDRIDYMVFNPTTKQYRLLQLDGYRPLYICLMCDSSKSECYKVLMVTGLTPLMKYSVYDPATQEWSHDFEGGEPFGKGPDVLGFTTANALRLNLVVTSIIQGFGYLRDPGIMNFPEESVYDNYMFDSNNHINIVQLKPFPEENKLSVRIGCWVDGGWVIVNSRKVGFNFKNSSTGVRLLGMMFEVGAGIEDAVFLFHVPGQLLIYKIYLGFRVLVDYRSDYFYVEDEWQFEHVHPFVHTFAPV